MQRYRPPPSLRDRIVSIDVVAHGGGDVFVLPSPGAVLGVQLAGGVLAGDRVLSPMGVTGVQKVARRYDYLGQTVSLLVRFTHQGASCLGVPASHLTNRSVAIDDLFGGDRGREMTGRVLDAKTPAEAVATLETLLSALPFRTDRLVERAVALLGQGADEDALVAQTARALSISERQLERRFLERVGLSPKRFASLRRFERAVAFAETEPSLTSVALDAGYYDQSHFVREFRRFTGVAPSSVLRPRR